MKVATCQSMLVLTVLYTLGRSIKSFVLDAICPLLLDLIVMYTSTLNIYPLLVEFDCRLYLLIKSFVLNDIHPLLLDLIVTTLTSVLDDNLHPPFQI